MDLFIQLVSQLVRYLFYSSVRNKSHSNPCLYIRESLQLVHAICLHDSLDNKMKGGSYKMAVSNCNIIPQTTLRKTVLVADYRFKAMHIISRFVEPSTWLFSYSSPLPQELLHICLTSASYVWSSVLSPMPHDSDCAACAMKLLSYFVFPELKPECHNHRLLRCNFVSRLSFHHLLGCPKCLLLVGNS